MYFFPFQSLMTTTLPTDQQKTRPSRPGITEAMCGATHRGSYGILQMVYTGRYLFTSRSKPQEPCYRHQHSHNTAAHQARCILARTKERCASSQQGDGGRSTLTFSSCAVVAKSLPLIAANYTLIHGEVGNVGAGSTSSGGGIDDQ